MTNKEFAIQALLDQHYTCAAYDGATLLHSIRRGVAPLLEWLDSGVKLTNFASADKVIGKGAAFLYVLLDARNIHAQIISRPALELLRTYGADVTFDTCVDAILNRDQTSFCPIESEVLTVHDPEQALVVIRTKLRQLRQ